MLPTIIFIASIFAVLYYLGVMQVVVRFFAKMMSRFMGASGAESTSVAASIFMGQTEAPLTIRPFLAEMTMSELMTIMTAGMAHISGGIMAAYVLVAKVDVIHLLTAVIMTAPGAIMMAKIIVPETEKPKTGGDVEVVVPKQDVNVIDAAGRGAIEGSAPLAQRRRHADRVHRAGGAGQRHLRLRARSGAGLVPRPASTSSSAGSSVRSRGRWACRGRTA